MRVWAIVRLVVVASALCSLNALGTELEFASRCIYAGQGITYQKDTAEPMRYLALLDVGGKIGNRDVWRFDATLGQDRDAHSGISGYIVTEKESDADMKVSVPNVADVSGNPSSFVFIRTGWAHKYEYEGLQKEEGTPKKRSILFNYLDTDGNRVTQHIFAYRKGGDGYWQLIITGSIGNDDGLIANWVTKLSETCVSSRDRDD